MRDEGQLAASRHGRELRYRLTGPFAGAVRKLSRHAPEPAPPWTDAFHALLYQVPEIHRPYRVRRHAAGRTHRHPRPDPTTRRRPGRGAARLPHPGRHDRPARSAWNLDAVADSFRGHIAILETALDAAAPPRPTAATLAHMADLLTRPTST
ncbi:hypothetical protein [Actinoplanes sp. NPDC051411]|uniref:hypothetical protein n=1 Tax=Actinoplanes sp. NPDC051411 TaxID=3155522 RepID=UPI0034421297